ncbi:MAG TPA: hypothetical protein VK501_01715 [Baekduia sp.]|uniref:hypothetical protein n=1 Tax=Baekduia sp. TaxID=2600305 RepID=UPI002BA9E697|nr:hypothetical protein [Baekduia sp.]HMJ32605.1 hypothetical protein [Baekduia sp.]
MILDKRLTAAAAVLGTLAIAAPISGASADAPSPASTAPSADVCASVAQAGAMAVLGDYGPLGAYGPTGDLHGQPNPATNCGGAISFALPGFTVGSFVNANLSIGQHAAGAPG